MGVSINSAYRNDKETQKSFIEHRDLWRRSFADISIKDRLESPTRWDMYYIFINFVVKININLCLII